MSIVLIGGHERMERVYKDTAKKHGCKLKVFSRVERDLNKRIGAPDYIFMFTDVVSHKMVDAALKISKQKDIPNLRIHNSSLNVFEETLKDLKNQVQ